MGIRFEQPKIRLFYHLHRLLENSEGLREYLDALREAPKEYTQQIIALPAAKVELVYGLCGFYR